MPLRFHVVQYTWLREAKEAADGEADEYATPAMWTGREPCK